MLWGNCVTASNELSVIQLIADASLLVQFVLLILLAASMLSWTLIFLKRNSLNTAEKEAKAFEERFWSGADLSDLYLKLTRRRVERAGLERIFELGFAEYARLRSLGQNEMMMESIQRSMRVVLAKEESDVEQHLSWLATIGSISPYIGLFGTVWGIMGSFLALGGATQATLVSVAPGIAEALIATAMGLFAAIPAVVAYNRYIERTDKIIQRYENFADEFVSVLQRQAMKKGDA